MERVTIHYDYGSQSEREKMKMLRTRLGEAGVICFTSDVDSDGFAPPTPWLQRGSAIYYAHEIDQAADFIIDDQSPAEQ